MTNENVSSTLLVEKFYMVELFSRKITLFIILNNINFIFSLIKLIFNNASCNVFNK